MIQATTSTDPFTLEALANTASDSLVPNQQDTPRGLLQQADCYLQRFIKYPGIVVCHSYAEFIHAIWLEMDVDVTSFVPQPFKLYVHGRCYIPDCYVIHKGQPQVIELKAEGQFNVAWLNEIALYFKWHDLPFSVISNDAMLSHETEALHWLPIIQLLAQANEIGIQTEKIEFKLLDKSYSLGTSYVGNLITPGATDQYLERIALYRLIYAHRLLVDLRYRPLSWDTELSLCPLYGDND